MKKAAQKISQQLRECFQTYQVNNLHSISADEFSRYVQSKIGVTDVQAEQYAAGELDQQRDLSMTFHWGHNHDFGSFQMEGKMADRHIEVLSNFIALFPITMDHFTNRAVFDIGCWTGGTTLLLAALGGKVFAIEEVHKYAQMVQFLAESFNLKNSVTVQQKSLFECNSEDFYDRFDVVHFPGVIYHLSDPVLALRILFNSLKIGGSILIESAGINVREPYCRFWGNRPVQKDNKSGWAWFWPSPSALSRMMKEAGFDEIQSLWNSDTGRVYAYGKKLSQVGICKAGLSVKDIR